MPYNFGNGQLVKATSQSRNAGVYIRTLFGGRIHENPVPVWTSEKENKPFVIFQDPKTGKKIGISKDMLSCGFLTIAEPGGGKTNLLNMITAMLLAKQENNDKIIIFDTKGDYYREFGSRIPPENCIVIGAGREYHDITWYHNIFEEIMPRGQDGRLVYTEETDQDALEKAKQLLINMQSETQPVFPSMAEQIIAGLLVYFVRSNYKYNQSRLNNKDFIDFILGSTNKEWKAVFDMDIMKDYRNCISYISGTGNQSLGVSSYVGTAIRELFVGPFAEKDPKKEFSMREIVQSAGKKVVFVEYDLRRGAMLEPMYGLMIDSALSIALGGRENIRNNVFFIMDEMLLLPKLKHINNATNFGRSQGVKILCGLQNFSSLADVYGETGAKSVLASFQNVFAFRSNEYSTRSFLIDRLGANYSNISYGAQQENIQIQRAGNMVEDWEILNLGLGEAIVCLKDELPFFFTMPKYRMGSGIR